MNIEQFILFLVFSIEWLHFWISKRLEEWDKDNNKSATRCETKTIW